MKFSDTFSEISFFRFWIILVVPERYQESSLSFFFLLLQKKGRVRAHRPERSGQTALCKTAMEQSPAESGFLDLPL
jgi:hypothetical protein